ncbi:hypothetical protein BGZ97_013364 [Linnemannia gamsii]|uniref:MFS general substrate transporter n=1 Tax=Linnemannia gamsii TaxID=64522 RepID=A0A9P6QZG9_9FUNG|nr:hypothetical protein BGZ97_013364 [Linnemannia gamsii]
MIGPRLCVAFGGFTFFLYAGAMYMAKDNDRSLYPPIAGILLGLGAGCIWVTQGAMMMSYPTEDNKGKYIACFWAIYNLGAVLGSVLPLTMFLVSKVPDQDDVSPETYIVYMVIMGLATLLGFFLSKPSSIVRDNGDPVVVAKFAGLKAETLAILSVFCDWRMLLLIPAFFFSNFSYTYQFNDFNGNAFNIGARSLNSAVFWIAQIIGAIVIGYMLDGIPVKRPRRAVIGLCFIGVLFMATWLAALMMQIHHNFDRQPKPMPQLITLTRGEKYPGLVAIYGMFGFCDAAFAVYCYWLMGALSNKHDELSRYAGFFKSIQSFGGAVAAPLDLARTPLLAYLITNWVLCAISIAAMFLVSRTITDTTIEDGEDDEYQEEEYDYDDATGSYITDDRSSHHRHHREEQHEMSSTTNVAGLATGAGVVAAIGGGIVQDLRPRDLTTRSIEGDQSTLCAISDNGKRISDSRSSGIPSSSWRSSSRASGLQDGGGAGYPNQELRHLGGNGHSNQGAVSSSGYSGLGSDLSYSSAVDRMTIPSRTYQTTAFHHNPTAADPSVSPVLRYPSAMSEIQQHHQDNSAGFGRTLWVEQPYPGGFGSGGGISPSTSIHSLYPGFQPTSSSPSGSFDAQMVPSSSYSPGLLPPSWSPHNSTSINSRGAPPSPVPPPAIATASGSGNGMFVPPTFMISDETSPSIPLYTFYPGSNFQNGSDIHLPGDLPHLGTHTPPPLGGQQPGQGGDAGAGAGVGPNGGGGYLQPFMPFDPMTGQHPLQRAGSATSSTSRYDDDQDMDSIDTHSISSMSSGHDSIPEMTEMSDTPTRHAAGHNVDSDED